jgi:hypothetical protein
MCICYTAIYLKGNWGSWLAGWRSLPTMPPANSVLSFFITFQQSGWIYFIIWTALVTVPYVGVSPKWLSILVGSIHKLITSPSNYCCTHGYQMVMTGRNIMHELGVFLTSKGMDLSPFHCSFYIKYTLPHNTLKL